MSQWIIYHNPHCSKSREALSILKEKGIVPRVIEYLKEPPGEEDLRSLIAMLSSDPSTLVRVKEDAFKEAPFDLKSIDAIVRNLARNPKLIERPIVIKGKTAVVARPVERLQDLLKQ